MIRVSRRAYLVVLSSSADLATDIGPGHRRAIAEFGATTSVRPNISTEKMIARGARNEAPATKEKADTLSRAQTQSWFSISAKNIWRGPSSPVRRLP
jgi:hypothetical protein